MPVIKARKSIVRKNSAGSDFIRRRINFIEGSNITLTVSDDSTNNEIDVTIAASAGSPGGSDTQVQYNNAGSFGGDDDFTFTTAAGVVINETGGASVDFRVEGDSDTHLFFIDASAGFVGINRSSWDSWAKLLVHGGAAFTDDFRFQKASGEQVISRLQEGSGGSSGYDLKFEAGNRDMLMLRGSGALEIGNSDLTGIVFNESGNSYDIRMEGDTATNLFVLDASADSIEIGTATQGVIAKFATAAIIFNEDGADRDFRVEGDTNANLLFVDASTDRVGIGTNSPEKRLHVVTSVVNDYGIQITHSATSGTSIGIRSVVGGVSSGDNYGFYASVSGGANNYAFYSNEAGRSYLRGRLAVGETVSNDNVIILADNNGGTAHFTAVNTNFSSFQADVAANITSGATTGILRGIAPRTIVEGNNTQNWTNDVGVRSVSAATLIRPASGTITGVALFHGATDTGTGGTVTNYYGLYLEDISRGSNNYAIVTNTGLVVFNEGGNANSDVRIEGDTDTALFTTDASTDSASIGVALGSHVGKFHIDQSSTTAAKPVLTVDQADVSEEFIRFIGTSANGVLTQSIVEAADVATPTVAGYLKVFVQDDGNQLTDQAYYLALYTLA